MSRGRHLAILLLVGACARAVPARSPGARPSRADAATALDPTRFEAEIRAFKNWTGLAADFPGVPVLNRGFGGSTLPDVVYYANRMVLP